MAQRLSQQDKDPQHITGEGMLVQALQRNKTAVEDIDSQEEQCIENDKVENDKEDEDESDDDERVEDGVVAIVGEEKDADDGESKDDAHPDEGEIWKEMSHLIHTETKSSRIVRTTRKANCWTF